jgi:hypothetical protein
VVFQKTAEVFTAKTAKKSSNASPASPVNTRTAVRAFELKIGLLQLIKVNTNHERFLAVLNFRVTIHSAVRVFTGEADEIGTQYLRFLR